MHKKGVWHSYVDAVGTVERAFNRGLGAWGSLVARHPVLTIIVSGVVALILTGGLTLVGDNTESDSDKLWVPQDSIWIKQEEFLDPRFGITDRFMQVIFESKSGNVLTADSIRDMFTVYENLISIPEADDGKTLTWTNGICWKSARNGGNDCRTSGVLNFFDDNVTMFEEVAAQGEAALLEALSADTYPDGGVATPDGIFVDAVRDSNGVLRSASMVMWSGVLDPDLDDDVVEDWSESVEDALEPGTSRAPTLDTINYYISAPDSIDSAIAESVGSDQGLIAVAIIVIFVFCTLALFVKDKVANRTSLALLGILTVILSVGSGFGLSLYLTIPFTSLTGVLPFILLGIGVDDIFVLVRSVAEVDELQPGLPIPDRFRKALNIGGMSITVTSLTNATAFMFGSMTVIPAVRWFCWSAAVSILLSWALQLTFFLACFVLTERRIDSQRYDCCCCWQRTPNFNESSAARANRPGGLMSGSKESFLQAKMNKYLLPALLHPAGKSIMLLFAVAMAVVGGIGITKLREGLPLSSLAPDDHYFRDFDAAVDRIERNSGYSANVFFRFMDQSDPAIQQKMVTAYEELLTAEYISAEQSPSQNWLLAFQEYAAQQDASNVDAQGAVQQAVFFDLLDDFLNAQPTWKDDIYRLGGEQQNPAARLEMVSSFEFIHAANVDDDGGYERKLINDMHDVGNDVNDNVFSEENEATDSGRVLILSSAFYKFIETDRIIFRELILNLGFALLGIAIIAFVLLIHPLAVLIMLACILLVDLGLFAEMWLLDIRLNTVSVVNLVMAVGLAVDYSMHILHTFLRKQGGSRQKRVYGAMLEIGAAVLLGALSTLLGIVVLAGSQSHIIRVFYELLMGTVIIGGIVGLLVLPVLLSFIGPGPCLAEDKSQSEPSSEVQSTKDSTQKDEAVV